MFNSLIKTVALGVALFTVVYGGYSLNTASIEAQKTIQKSVMERASIPNY